MNPLAQMNRALDDLEEQLTGEIDWERIARTAGCSQYHFRRMFSYLAGMSLGEYVRCRRLALAGRLLQQGCRVMEVAVLLGYDSADAFRRAFHAMHGIPPSGARRPGAALKAFPTLRFQLTVQGGSKMDYRIVSGGPFRIVGFQKRITLQYEGVNPQMDSLVARLTPQAIAQLKTLCDVEPAGMLSVSANFAERTAEGSQLDQYLGVATTKPAPPGYDSLEVAACQWAVFPVTGPFPQTVQDAWARIFSQWLPGSEFQLTGGPELLWHESPDLTGPDCHSELWIPVEPRKATA